MGMNRFEKAMQTQIRALGLPEPVSEYRMFAEIAGTGKGLRARLKEKGFKDYRFDFAWPQFRLALEINGSIWTKGGHSSGRGLIRDYDKINQAQMQKWDVLIFTTEQVMNGEAIVTLKNMIGICERGLIDD